MTERYEIRKYVLTVEGETEQWYFYWLRDQINAASDRTCDVSIEAKVEQSPKKYYKGLNAKTTPQVYHICDMESNEAEHAQKFDRILSEMREAKTQKKITYILGYSNFTFELWMILHKKDCNGAFLHRQQYLSSIRQAYGEQFEDLAHYKEEAAFKRCLRKITIEDVKTAIRRADTITQKNAEQYTLNHKKGYSFYRENPALSIHMVVKTILKECGLYV